MTRPRSMGPVRRRLGALLVLAAAVRAPAQGLDLTPPPPIPAPAELAPAADVQAALDLALTRLRLARQAATGRQVAAVEAMIALRELARATCRGAAAQDWRRMDVALRLVDALPTIDARIRARMLEDDAKAAAASDAALVRFAALVPDDGADLSTADRVAALSTLLLALDPDADPGAGWPRIDDAGGAAMPPRPPTQDALRTRLAALQPAEPLQARLAALLPTPDDTAHVLDPGQAMAMAHLLDLLEAVANAGGGAGGRSGIVDRQRREAFETHVSAIAEALPGPDGATHRQARRMAREASESAAVLRAAEDARPALGEAARSLSGLPALLLRLDTQVAPDATPPPWRAKRAVADLLRRAAEGRALEVDVKGPDLSSVRRTLLVDCRQTEKSLLDALATLLEADSPQADPALSSLLRSHQRLVEDLRWLGTLDDMASRMATRDGAVDAPLRDALRAEMLEIASGLADPTRRPDALQARIQLQRQAEAFEALPGETLPPGMISLLGADRAAAIRTTIASARRDWVAAWSSGEGGGAAARRLLAALRLMRCADALSTLGDTAARQAVIATLSRWSGWSVPEEALEKMASESSAPLDEPLAALSQGTPSLDQVRDVERRTALLRLALRLSGELARSTGPSPSPAAAALGPLVAPVPDDAWGFDHLEALARIGVLARAWLAARDETASGALRAALDWEADALLQRLGEWRGPIPTLR